jgi:L,D-transpeptidase YcbB
MRRAQVGAQKETPLTRQNARLFGTVVNFRGIIPNSSMNLCRWQRLSGRTLFERTRMRPSLFATVASAHICLAVSAFQIPLASAETLDGVVSSPNQAIETALPESGSTDTTATETTVMPADAAAPLALKLQDLVTTRLSDYIARKDEKSAVEAFYRERGFQPLWTTDGAVNARAQAVIGYLKNVGSEGLDPNDYPVPNFAAISDDEGRAAAELKLTHAVLTFARHASSGRVSYTRVSAAILYPAHALDPAQVLTKLAASDNPRDTLASFEPQHAEYKALKAQLAKELAAPDTSPLAAYASDAKPRKGKASKPVQASKAQTIALIAANMERWRWVPRELGATHVTVNIPDYTLAVFNNGNQVWQTKIVAGQPGERATPLLSETMKYLTINPTWNVPPSIIRNEYLPALQRDPGALERIGLKVGRNHDGSLRVYQPPGAKNALGRIRFNFPNPFLVYQHDTPNKNLFAKDQRAFSHGCMRVENPERYAEILLSLSQPKDAISAERIRKMYGDEERTINLQHPIPVHVTYQTAFVDAGGRLKIRDDVYGLDAAVLKLMHGGGRSVADTPIARNYESSSKPVAMRLPRNTMAYGDDDRRERHSLRAEFTTPFGLRMFDRAVGTW